jgi:hypothetical protein
MRHFAANRSRAPYPFQGENLHRHTLIATATRRFFPAVDKRGPAALKQGDIPVLRQQTNFQPAKSHRRSLGKVWEKPGKA